MTVLPRELCTTNWIREMLPREEEAIKRAEGKESSSLHRVWRDTDDHEIPEQLQKKRRIGLLLPLTFSQPQSTHKGHFFSRFITLLKPQLLRHSFDFISHNRTERILLAESTDPIILFARTFRGPLLGPRRFIATRRRRPLALSEKNSSWIPWKRREEILIDGTKASTALLSLRLVRFII